MMETAPGESRPRKRVRKGAHSCIECKRRKVRCTFPSNGASVCVECALRGTMCVGQDYDGPDNPIDLQKKNVRDRVGRLEALVESLVHKIGIQNEKDPSSHMLDGLATGALTPSSEASLDTPGQIDNAPVLSLFDNDVWSLRREESNDSSSSADTAPQRASFSALDNSAETARCKHGKISQALLAVFPAQSVMEAVFDATDFCWIVWQQSKPFFVGSRQYNTIREFVAAAMSDGRPHQLARVLLSFCLSVQQLSSDQRRHLSLPVPTDCLLDRYTSAVRRLVTSQEDLLSDLDGLDSLHLQARYLFNLGQPRKAWLCLQRAISLAQLLGINRTTSLRGNDGRRSAIAEIGRLIWADMFQCDRFLSLLLGLQYTAIDKHFETNFLTSPMTSETPEMEYKTKLGVISGHIVDLHQAGGSLSVQAVERIDRELDNLASQMPNSWWDLPTVEKLGIALCSDRNLVSFWHHHVKVMLHLPLMVLAARDHRYNYNRLICLSSAREMVRRYQHMSTLFGDSVFCCKVFDFEAFIATVILLLNLAGHRSDGATPQEQQRISQDWAMVDDVVGMIRTAAADPANVAAAQSLKVLDTIYAGRNRTSALYSKGASVRIAIPYFGTITIGPGARLASAAAAATAAGEAPKATATAAAAAAAADTADAAGEHAMLATPGLTPDSESCHGSGASPASWVPSLESRASDEPLVSLSSLQPVAPFAPEQAPGLAYSGFAADGFGMQDAFNFDLDQNWDWLTGEIGIQ